MNKKILLVIFSIFLVAILPHISLSIPPRPISTTSISEPSISGNSEKVIEINFSISQNQITLQSISIKNLPQAVINPTSSDYYLEITDAGNKVLYKSNILAVFDSRTNLSQQYYAIAYPNGAKYLYFYYQNQQIAKYDVPQEFPWFYVIIGIVVVIVLIAIYFISRKYTIQI